MMIKGLIRRRGTFILVVFMLIAGALVLSGCELPGWPDGDETRVAECEIDGLVAPMLVDPAAGATVNTALPILEWSYPGDCEPGSYRIDLSTDASFADTSLSGGTGTPSTSWAPGSDLADCTLHYWRVAVAQDTSLGPWSDVRTFYTDIDGTCPPPEFAVTAVSTSVTPASTTTTCGDWTRFEFTGTFTTNGPGTVEYTWDRSDLAVAPMETFTAPSAGSWPVTASWDIAGPPGDYWMALHVMAPNNMVGNQAVFTLDCTGGDPATCATESLMAPNLSAPANGGTAPDIWPSLSWTYPDDCVPEGYRIDLSTESSFADTSLSGGTGNPSTSWAPGHALDPATLYYWRVAPINGTTLGPFSATWSFTTPGAAACEMVAPVLSAPANGSVTADNWPTQSWTYSGDCLPEGYRIDLSTDPGFADTSLSGGTGSPSTSWAAGHELDPDTTYYWRVAGMIGTTSGPWSATWSFTTPGGCSMLAPTLVDPTDGGMVTELRPTLSWYYSAPATHVSPCMPEGYRISLSSTPDFSDTTYNGGTGNPSTSWAPGPDLVDCTVYYWRVAGMIGTTSGPWSDTWTFLVDTTAGKCEP